MPNTISKDKRQWMLGKQGSPNSQAGDEAALEALYTSTNGASWTDSTGWAASGMSLDGNIYGVTTHTVGGELRVRSIKLNGNETLAGWGAASYPENVGVDGGNNLAGTLPPEIGNLKECLYINVKQNFLTGAIPPEIGDMTNLEWCALAGQYGEIDISDHQWNENNHAGAGSSAGKGWYESNTFNSEIPFTIGNLKNLLMFECRRQYLTGTIPAEMGSCDSLVGIFLNDSKGANPLGGALPPELGNLGNTLKHFHIDSRSNDATAFSGDMPTEIINGWSEVRHVRIRDNDFTGNIPDFPNAYDLHVYTAVDNGFTGGFPTSIFQGDHPTLNNFLIGANNLSGPLPTESEVTFPDGETSYNAMSKFGLDGNDFEGAIPDWIQQMAGHQVFDVRNNSFTGGFPEKIMDRTELKTLLISGNSFGGPLPDRQWATDRLITIYANNCGFTGGIPDGWSNLTAQSMWLLYLQGNELEGLIPQWLGDMGADRVYLYNNKFTPKDIVPNLNYIIAGTATDEYRYTPQKPFGQDGQIQSVGDVIDLSLFDYTNNSYQWEKAPDGESSYSDLTGETSHTINTTSYGAGFYRLKITHPDISGYTFESSPIEVI